MAKKGKIALTILLSIVFIAIFVSLVNLGISIFLDEPDYDDYCTINESPEGVRDLQGEYLYCDYDSYELARADYNQIRFYILAGLGLVFVLVGMFIPLSIVQWTGIVTGGIFLVEGIVFNFANKALVFTTLIVILIVMGLGAWRVLKK